MAMAESEGEVVGLIDEVVAWLATEDPTPLAILGGYGAGKSSFAKRLVTQQAAQALTDPSARRPILIKLGGLSRYSCGSAWKRDPVSGVIGVE